jgi:hypothetical protein
MRSRVYWAVAKFMNSSSVLLVDWLETAIKLAANMSIELTKLVSELNTRQSCETNASHRRELHASGAFTEVVTQAANL